MVGLLAVMIVLLFIMPGFVVIPHTPRSASVDLAKVRHAKEAPRANREDAIIVGIQRDGAVYFGNTRVSIDPTAPGALAPQIRKAVAEGADPRVYVRADARARYGAVKDAIDGIREAGIDRITFLVYQDQR